LIAGFAKFFNMSPVEVLIMPWLLFIDLLNYKNDEIEKENKTIDEQKRELKRGRK